MSDHQPAITVGRYLLHRRIARGGMATIHIARLMGDVGFSRIVAAKRMHPELAEDSEFVQMFLDEARIASKVNHRNVVPVLDVVTMGTEVMLVQEYIHGASLSLLLRTSCEAKAHVPIPVAAAIACGVLAGLHAAHETVDEMGVPLHVVHRDVSPQNIMVATDGSARLLDFGVAKAALAAHVTRKGMFKGKLGYSSPEQIRGDATKQSDIYSLAVVFWELLVGHRLHGKLHGEAQLVAQIMAGRLPTITDALADERSFIGAYRWGQLEALEPIIRKGLDVHARRRWATAADMEEAIAAAVPIASANDVGAWLKAVAKDFLEERDKVLAEEEASWRQRGNAPPAADAPLGMAIEPDGKPSTSAFMRRAPMAIIAVLVVLLAISVAFLMRDLEHQPAPSVAANTTQTTPAPASTTTFAATSPTRATSATTSKAPTTTLIGAAETTTTTAAAPTRTTSATTSATTSKAPTTTSPTTSATTTAGPSHILVVTTTTASSTSRAIPADVNKADASDKAKPTTRATARPRTQQRPPPPRPTPPPPTPTRATPVPPPKPVTANLDCDPPFYFEGRKKIFKSGCL